MRSSASSLSQLGNLMTTFSLREACDKFPFLQKVMRGYRYE